MLVATDTTDEARNDAHQMIAEMGFVVGKLVTVSSRHTGLIDNDPRYRKDVSAKSIGTIQGHSDSHADGKWLRVSFEIKDSSSSGSQCKKTKAKTQASAITVHCSCHVDKLKLVADEGDGQVVAGNLAGKSQSQEAIYKK